MLLVIGMVGIHLGELNDESTVDDVAEDILAVEVDSGIDTTTDRGQTYALSSTALTIKGEELSNGVRFLSRPDDAVHASSYLERPREPAQRELCGGCVVVDRRRDVGNESLA